MMEKILLINALTMVFLITPALFLFVDQMVRAKNIS